MPDATGDDPTTDSATSATADAATDPVEDQKRRFKEALDRKRGAQHPDDAVLGGRNLHGRGGDTNRHDFRRKSG